MGESAREVWLAHGASGSALTIAPWVTGLGQRGVTGHAVPAAGKLPLRAERAMQLYREQLAGRQDVVIGGVSYGGRVASMIAAEDPLAGLVLLSYPLHPPGKQDQQRVAHLASIHCPVLFMSGEADPFAQLELLRAAVRRLAQAELVTYPRTGHGLSRNPTVMADCLDRIAAFARQTAAA
ncbi:MAG TPA: alpha/beta family hydrolase [Candidatus Dormibacteraeota bacterium]|nr:alpha/beta family hydrolase [Candidatus Dormibacteraeota bacterium]